MRPPIEEVSLDEARDFRPEGSESLSRGEGQCAPAKEG